jgi:hypothetical protein
MKNTLLAATVAGFCLAAVSAQAVSINLSAGVVRDGAGAPLADGSLMILQSAGPNGTFGNVTASQFSDDPDDILIPAAPYLGTFAMDSSTTFNPPNSGIHLQGIFFNHGDVGLQPLQKLRLLWFPGLPVNAAAPGGGQSYGTYTDQVGIDGSAIWEVPANNAATLDFNMNSVANFGSLSDAGPQTWATNITAVDTPPTAICQNVSVNAAGGFCDANVTAAQVNNGSSDAQGPVTLAISPSGPFPIGATVVTLTVTDNASQTSTCTATVTVNDPAPTIACPANINQLVPPGTVTSPVTFTTPSGSDNCTGVSVVCSPASGDSFPVGAPTTVTCTATDSSSQTAQCTFDVTLTEDTGCSCADIDAIRDNVEGSDAPSYVKLIVDRYLDIADLYLDLNRCDRAEAYLDRIISRVNSYKARGKVSASTADCIIACVTQVKNDLCN